MVTYKDLETKTLQGMLNDGIGELMRKFTPLPTLQGKGKGWDDYYSQKAQTFLTEVDTSLKNVMPIARELLSKEMKLVEFWEECHVAPRNMPQLSQLLDDAAGFFSLKVKKVVGSKKENQAQKVADTLLELQEVLCRLTYTGLSDEDYEKLYQAKLRAVSKMECNSMLIDLLRVRVPQSNPIFNHELTFHPCKTDLYRKIFSGEFSLLDLEQYFIFKSMVEKDKQVTIQVKSFQSLISQIKDGKVPEEKKTETETISVLSPEHFQFTWEKISHCKEWLNEGVTEFWVKNCLQALFGSECAEDLERAFKRTKNKKIAMIMGRLVACGIYEDRTDVTFAESLQLSDNIKLESITHYVNDGRKSEYDSQYSFLPWIDKYCQAHNPTTSA